MSQEDLVALGQSHLYPNYRQPPLVLTRGEGSRVWDAAGKQYFDLFAGIAVSTLGHGHPRLAAAIAEQAKRLIHVSNYFYNQPNVELAAKLCRLTGMQRVFFCNSGTEAIEASLKLARRHFFAKGEAERLRVIAFDNSFHGRTLGALAATGQPKYRDGFGPLPGVTHVPYGDVARVRQEMGPDVAGILVEAVQGEGGVLPAPEGFLAALRDIVDEAGALLIADEVQTGIGRTGKFLGFDQDGVKADVVALAKGLGGGVPIGAMLCQQGLAEALPPGSHGSTFGGNPLASAAALAVLDVMEQERLLERVEQRGAMLARRLGELRSRHARLVATTRGRGLLQALVLKDEVDARALLGRLQDAGVLLTIAGGQALRVSPPLTISEDELNAALDVVDGVFGTWP
ncbi:MAG TPA: acetylornithine/succinylornithine family transaminase [Polyangiaceae bacterium]|nr:acetylornithine/succinylornithine family transaminase [Polyangiaceae bacterium]